MKKWIVLACMIGLVGAGATVYQVLQSPGPSPVGPKASGPSIPPLVVSRMRPEPQLAKKEAPQPPAIPPSVVPVEGGVQALQPVGYQVPKKYPSPETAGQPVDLDFKLRREGTVVSDLVGTVRRQGDRLRFFPEQGPPMDLLENLLLQHLQDRQSETSRPMRWKVSGELTEYRLANYLLLKKIAVEKEP